jgi:hypothetical protein
MGANEEQIMLLVSAHVDPVSYSLVLYSLAFVVYFCTFSFITTNSSYFIPNMAVHKHRPQRRQRATQA